METDPKSQLKTGFRRASWARVHRWLWAPSRWRALACLAAALGSWALLAPYVRLPIQPNPAGLWIYAAYAHFEPTNEGEIWNWLERDDRPWSDRVERELRHGNPEWSLLFRLFRVLSEVNMRLDGDWGPAGRGLRGASGNPLAAIDQVIDDTLRLEREHGQEYFLLSYAKKETYRVGPQRSAFIDGEIALMIAARQLATRELLRPERYRGRHASPYTIPTRPELTAELRTRLASLEQRMRQSPVLCAESYPDECWTFCTVVTLNAMRMLDALDGTRHHAGLITDWLAVARRRLIDADTGLLISSFTQQGRPSDGPEGSSIWFVAHMLQLLDPAFAREQYNAAKGALAVSAFGLGFAREWPSGHKQGFDIDVGTWIPVLEAGAASSGFAVLAAHSFDDERYLHDLLTSLSLFGQPVADGRAMHLAQAGAMGNVVLLYGLSANGLRGLVEVGS